MRIILTRHGRTEENDAWILQGHLPGTLSENGWLQAQKVAERLKFEKIDYVYSSDLARSANTAKEIMKFHQEVPVEFTADLRETFLGEWQWKTKMELGLVNNPKSDIMAPKDWETLEAITERCEKFLEKIMSRHANDAILLVGHNGVNRRLVWILTGKDSVESIKNTSVSIFDIDTDRRVHMRLFNCTQHLD